MAEFNAYALLTNIQGFDSFSLGPSSSPEEIARAFQTQVRAAAPRATTPAGTDAAVRAFAGADADMAPGQKSGRRAGPKGL